MATCPDCRRGTLMPRKLPRSGAHYHQCDRCGWQTGMRFVKPPRNWGALSYGLSAAALLTAIVLLKLHLHP